MKFHIILFCAVFALALAEDDKEKDKPKEDKDKEKVEKLEKDVLKPKEIEIIWGPSAPIKEGLAKESVMDWESSYGSYPVEVLRGYNPYRELYPGLYPSYLGYPAAIPYGFKSVYDPEEYYNHFGFYPVSKK